MRKVCVMTLLFIAITKLAYPSDAFLGVPLIPGATIIHQDNQRLEFNVNTNYDEAVRYYSELFRNLEDLKIKDRGSQTYIEDHSNREWHSVSISKLENDKIKIVILKDNWTWILGTLVLRFVAVFAVLIVLYLAMTLTGAIVSRMVSTHASR
ncbi:MAG: hypothetical protein AB7V04_04230 [Desulfomonilaceae bacterium]